jgi:CRISPR system Cascade subunit CasE
MSDTGLIASVLRLTRSDIKALRIADAYALHRVVYSLFEDIRGAAQKQASTPSGILYADKGGDFDSRRILILSNRPPKPDPGFGEIDSRPIPADFLQHAGYAFEVIINPSKRDRQTGKTVAVRGREAIAQWFAERAPQSWGFEVEPARLQLESLSVQTFAKDGQTVTHGGATLKGILHVSDRECFKRSFRLGIGRGRAFGFGLLQIIPLRKHP